MTSYDFSPLFRSAIGFDRLARVMSAAASEGSGYPPYNIEKTGEDSYRLTMAVAGFAPGDVDVTVQDNTLTVNGRAANTANEAKVLYRGIAGRTFERRFALAEHIVVESASLENGLLHVGLKRVVPEALKPRRITVTSGTPTIAPGVAPGVANDATQPSVAA